MVTTGVEDKAAGAHVRAFWRAMMKSGLPPLKTILAEAWTHSQCPVLVNSLKMLKPLSPVLITEEEEWQEKMRETDGNERGC